MRSASQRRSEILRSAARFCMEQLEGRVFLSVSNPIVPTPILPTAPTPLQGVVSTPNSLGPTAFNTSYEFNQIYYTKNGNVEKGDGSGETVAIVDAYGSPTIIQDLETFDAHWGITNADSTGVFALTVQPLAPTVNTTVDVGAEPGWAEETALDVEWVHAVAPGAHILLVEAPSASIFDMLDANVYAAAQKGVVAVSNSWGIDNGVVDQTAFQVTGEPNEPSIFDGYFATPNGHLDTDGLAGGVTFLAASGDTGGAIDWPATSLSTISVGGMTVSTDINGNTVTIGPWSGSGGGADPNYVGHPNEPIVALDADPQTGVWVYDGATGWTVVGGTSLATPGWAGYVAIIDQGLNLEGKGSTDTATLQNNILFAEEATPGDYFDTFQFPAPNTMYPLWPMNGPVPDLNITPDAGHTGWGIPIGINFADYIVSDASAMPLVPASNGVTSLTAGFGIDYFTVPNEPANAQTGVAIQTITADINNSANAIDSNFNGPVTISIDPRYSTAGGVLQGTLTVNAVNGVVSFSGLSIVQTGNYTFKLTGSNVVSSDTTQISILNGAATHVVFLSQPSSAWQFGPIPAFSLELLDANGNVATSSAATFTVAIVSGPAGGILSGQTSVAVAGGIATFAGLNVDVPGNYTFSVSGPGFATLFSGEFQVVSTPVRHYLFNAVGLSGNEIVMQQMRNSVVFASKGPPPATLVAAVAEGVGADAAVVELASPAVVTADTAAVESGVGGASFSTDAASIGDSATSSLLSDVSASTTSNKDVLGN